MSFHLMGPRWFFRVYLFLQGVVVGLCPGYLAAIKLRLIEARFAFVGGLAVLLAAAALSGVMSWWRGEAVSARQHRLAAGGMLVVSLAVFLVAAVTGFAVAWKSG